MAKLFNLARMSTATTGTGTITLGSAVSGFLSFAGAGVADGDTITYGIRDGSNSEIGRGVYTASGTTLTRTVLKSTNSDAAISLSGTAEVFVTPAAEDFVGLRATWVLASEMTRRTTNGAARTEWEHATNDIAMWTLDYDQTTEEGAGVWWWPEDSWDAGTIICLPVWTASTGSGGVVWSFMARCFSNDDPMDVTPDGEQTSADTFIVAGDMHIAPATSAMTVQGAPTATEPMYIQVKRLTGDAGDTLTGDARLIGFMIYYSVNHTSDD